jgi:voltage-gated potassium channel
MPNWKQIRRKWWLLLPLVPIVGGTVGFRLIEGWRWSDAIFMTVITISTVGYGDGGMSDVGKMFASFLILTGVGTFTYVISYGFQEMVENSNFYERQVLRKVHRMKDHYIICGAGRVGIEIAETLQQKKIPYVIIESNLETIETLKIMELPYIHGDATNDEVLISAGADHAKGMACVLNSDADNVFASLAGRELNPKLFIVARANSKLAVSKMLKAGANKVLNPFSTTAFRMATTLLKPTVTNFLEVASRSEDLALAIEELLIPVGSELDGVTIADSQRVRRKM